MPPSTHAQNTAADGGIDIEGTHVEGIGAEGIQAERVQPGPSAAVAWHGWNADTLASARRERKPVFLSIGSPTCDWRHLMDRESFRRPDVARLLADHFVAIRVDREERPDLDHLYSAAVQAMTGRSGRLLTVVLTPDLEPFFGGAYFRPDDGPEGPGLVSILTRIAALWKENARGAASRAGQVATILRQQAETQGRDDAGTHLYGRTLANAVKALRAQFDAENGGFGRAPKAPAPHALAFLLRYAQRTGDRESAEMVRITLEALAAGGIHDHLGGGFHHYAADDRWLAPHFEKLLPDQAGLVLVYTDAYLHSRSELCARMARETCDYVLDSLTSAAGGFCAAEGAAGKELEERYYTWTGAEIIAVLDPECGRAFGRAFGVRCEDGQHGPAVLHRTVPAAPLTDTLEQARRRLLAVRGRRPRPGRDERVIAAWSGQMIEALARAGLAFEEPRYVAAAERAANYLKENLWSGGRLLRCCCDGDTGAPGFAGSTGLAGSTPLAGSPGLAGAPGSIGSPGSTGAPGYLEDHAQLGRGLLALYEATFDPTHLAWAVHLAREMIRLFAHPAGGFTCAGRDAEPLIAPVVDTHDGELPSGNASAILFLLRLGALTGDGDLTARAVARMRKALASRYLPNAVVLLHPDITAAERHVVDRDIAAHLHMIRSLAPFVERMRTVRGAATAHVCRNHACATPVQDVAGLERQLVA
jgi:uncharacterized protein YyaL (SSP411 family)